MIFQPLQSFFDYHKVYRILKLGEELTNTEALGIVILHPDTMDDSVQVDNLDLILEDINGVRRYATKNNAVRIERSEDLSGSKMLALVDTPLRRMLQRSMDLRI